MNTVINIFIENYPIFIRGTINTIIISSIATILGFFIGLCVALARNNKIGNIIANIYVTIFRGTPMMVQAMIFYYALPPLLGNFRWSDISIGNISIGPILAGIIIVTINTGAYLAETIRSGIQALDQGQFEAAKSLGFSKNQSMRYIILPQAIKNVIPAIGNEFIVNIKDTAVLNVITVSELFFVSSSIAGSNFMYLQTFYITALIYLLLTSIFSYALHRLEYHLNNKQKSFTSIPASQTNLKQLNKIRKDN
ncbi:MAG: amino acid ABC transporter permease [Bacilli bacterium]